MQVCEDTSKRYCTFTQLTKQAVLQRGEVIPALFAGLFGNLWLTILEMHVTDTSTKAAQAIQDQLTISAAGAVEIMTGIKHQSKQVRIGHVEEASDLLRRLDIARAVMMERDRQPGGRAYNASNTFCPTSEGCPLDSAQSHSGGDTPGIARAHGISAVVIGKDNEWKSITFLLLSHRCQQSCHFQR